MLLGFLAGWSVSSHCLSFWFAAPPARHQIHSTFALWVKNAPHPWNSSWAQNCLYLEDTLMSVWGEDEVSACMSQDLLWRGKRREEGRDASASWREAWGSGRLKWKPSKSFGIWWCWQWPPPIVHVAATCTFLCPLWNIQLRLTLLRNSCCGYILLRIWKGDEDANAGNKAWVSEEAPVTPGARKLRRPLGNHLLECVDI